MSGITVVTHWRLPDRLGRPAEIWKNRWQWGRPALIVLGLLVFVLTVPRIGTAGADDGTKLEFVPAESSLTLDNPATNRGCTATHHDEVWVVSVRGLGCRCDAKALLTASGCWRLEDGGRWGQHSLPSLLEQPGSGQHTIVYVHGNRVDAAAARSQGLAVFRSLTRCQQQRPDVRFVIWSWASDRIRGVVQDVRVKARRTDAVGCQLARFLEMLPPDQSLGLLGYSFGARVITGALHLADGGQIGQYQLSGSEQPALQARVVTMAAAVDRTWLEPNRRHGRALNQIEQILLVNNSCDRVLRSFGLVECHYDPVALGYAGVASWGRLGEYRQRVKQRDWGGQIGRKHGLDGYILRPAIMQAAWDGLTQGP